MKKILKLLLMVAPLLMNSGLCATITAPSQLAPKKDIIYSPNLQNNATLTITSSNGATTTVQRTSTDKFLLNGNTNVTIANNTILTPLEINVKTNGLPTLTLNGDPKNNIYYIDTLQCQDNDDLLKFIQVLNKAINNTDALICIKEIRDQNGKLINKQVLINKDQAEWHEVIPGSRSMGITPNRLVDFNVNSHKATNFESSTTTFSKKIYDQATQERLNINKITNKNIEFPKQIEALNTIERLNSVTSPVTLNNEDKDIIKKANIDYLKASDNKEIDQNFLLQFNSTALEAEKICITEFSDEYVKKNTAQNISNDKLLEALDKTIKIVDPLKGYRALQEELAQRLAFDQANSGDGTAVVDWYLNLNPDEQLLMEYDIKAVYGQEHILNMDPNLLNDAERAEVKIYINDLLSRTSNSDQQKDLQAKIDAIDAVPADAQKLQDLQTKLQTYSDPKQENAMIDWISTLSDVDRQSINEDIQAILVANIFTEAYNSYATQKGSKTSIKEVFQLKQTLESLLQDPEQELDPILDKAIVQFKTKGGTGWITNETTLSDDMAQNVIGNKINRCADTIQNLLLDHIEKNGDRNSAYVNLLDPNNTSDYATIFRKLSLQEQKSVFDNIGQRENDLPTKDKTDAKAKRAAQLETYQNATLSERIQEAGTAAELSALQDDVKAAGVTFGATEEKEFSNKFSIVETAENKAIAKGEPFVPEDKPTDVIIFDPTAGQTDVVNTTTGEKIPVPAGGGTTNPADAEAQAQIAKENPKLAKEEADQEAKETADEQAREDAAKTQDAINEANREGGGGGVEAI